MFTAYIRQTGSGASQGTMLNWVKSFNSCFAAVLWTAWQNSAQGLDAWMNQTISVLSCHDRFNPTTNWVHTLTSRDRDVTAQYFPDAPYVPRDWPATPPLAPLTKTSTRRALGMSPAWTQRMSHVYKAAWRTLERFSTWKKKIQKSQGSCFRF